MALFWYNAQADERLLCTGDLSDVLVRCGDKSWQLHRLILSSRCVYFRTGLENAWILGDPAYFYINEQDVEAVSWIITFIYTGRLPYALTREDGSIFTDCLRLICCSRNFLLSDLTTYAQQHLYAASQKTMIEAQTAYKDAEDSDVQFEVSELDGFFDGVKKVYEDDDLQTEKQYFIDVVQSAHFWPMLDSTFKEKAQDIPEFWNDIMVLQQDAITNGAYWPCWKPEECHKCKSSPWQFQEAPRSTHWATLKLVKGRCLATCNYCASMEENGKPVEDSKQSKNPKKGEKEKDKGSSSSKEEQALSLDDDDYEVSSDEELTSGEVKRTKRQKGIENRLMKAEQDYQDRKMIEWLLKVGGGAVTAEKRRELWKKVDQMRQKYQR